MVGWLFLYAFSINFMKYDSIGKIIGGSKSKNPNLPWGFYYLKELLENMI